MTSQWQTDPENDHVYGKLTDNRLIGTRGVGITKCGEVWIGYTDQDGMWTGPVIYCNGDAFETSE